jgi:hypothetical protein
VLTLNSTIDENARQQATSNERTFTVRLQSQGIASPRI